MAAVSNITIAAAAVGAVLGIINTAWALRRDLLRLRVQAVWMYDTIRFQGGAGAVMSQYSSVLDVERRDGSDLARAGRLGVRVTNLGLAEVTIDGVGLTSSGFIARRIPRKRRRMPIMGDSLGAVSLPVRLKSRESITVWSAPNADALRGVLSAATRVYASTACGADVYGTSGLLRRLVKQARKRD